VGGGEVLLSRLFWSTRLAVEDIHDIDDGRPPITREGQDNRELHVHHAGGISIIPYFSGVPDLIAHIRSLNPNIILNGDRTVRRPVTTPVVVGGRYELRYPKVDV